MDLTRLYEALTRHIAVDIEPDSSVYLPGTRGWDWDNPTGKHIPCKAGSYEQKIEAFLAEDPGNRDPVNNLMIVLGGIGTGKSTTIRRALRLVASRPRTCSKAPGGTCTRPQTVLLLDFHPPGNALEPAPAMRDGEPPEAEEAFWNFVHDEIQSHTVGMVPPEDETSRFVKWAVTAKRIPSEAKELRRYFASVVDLADAAIRGRGYGDAIDKEGVRRLLLEQKAQAIRTFPALDSAWYQALLLRYHRDHTDHHCECVFVVLDNIDQLIPHVQRVAVRAVTLLRDLLGARCVVGVRPLTWSQSVHAHALQRREPHFSPAVTAAVATRIKSFLDVHRKTGDDAPLRRVRDVSRAFTGSKTRHPLAGVLEATAGLSLRFALRNFENMFQSDMFRALPDAGEIPVATLAHAFFCGEGRTLNEDAFNNLYSLGHNIDIGRALIKPRMLDLLVRRYGGKSNVSRLYELLRMFGYLDYDITDALNDLLSRKRPLVWCYDGHVITSSTSNASVIATPTGFFYINEMFGERYYCSVCLSRGNGATSDDEIVSFHRDLTTQDLKEIAACAEHHSVALYQSLYGSGVHSLSAIHWRQLARGLGRHQAKRSDGVALDTGREDWIAAQVAATLKRELER